MRRLLILLACSLILWVIVTQINHAATGIRVYLFVGGLFVTFSALTQPFAPGLSSAMLSGLIFDANTPVAFGTHMVLFAATHVVVYRLRDRVPRNDTISRVTVAVLANLALFLVFSFSQLLRSPAISGAWPRLFIDLICSQIFLALVAPWFFALQSRSLVLARVERESFA
jgi:cell shape-determining protein MreD